MIEVATVTSKESMYQYLRDCWRFQVQSGKKHGTFPNLMPSKIYISLFGSLPYASANKAYLKQLDNDFLAQHADDYQFVFKYKGGTYPVLVTAVSSYEEALKKAIARVISKSNFGINAYSLAKHLMNTGELTMDFQQLK